MLRNDHVDTELQVSSGSQAAASAPSQPAAHGLAGMTDDQLKERIKPLVLDILTEELYRLTRRGNIAGHFA
jgi:hypothetical protein